MAAHSLKPLPDMVLISARLVPATVFPSLTVISIPDIFDFVSDAWGHSGTLGDKKTVPRQARKIAKKRSLFCLGDKKGHF